MTTISTVAADEAETLLWWDVERLAEGIRCRIWIVRHPDDEAMSPGAVERPERSPDFEETAPTEVLAIDYLAGDDVCLRSRAEQIVGMLLDH